MEKILIVDDDKNISELLRLYLVKEGYETILAFDGEEALAVFGEERPDLEDRLKISPRRKEHSFA